jgi:23S rRNA pseudouridine1911/1915/1917 synthase
MSSPSVDSQQREERLISAEEAGQRLDHLLARWFGVSVQAARRFIEEGLVRIAGRLAKKGDSLSLGARVLLHGRPARPEELAPLPEPARPLSILFQDEALLALSKAAQQATHPLAFRETGTLANALVARFPECVAASLDPREGGLCHRLDTETSGVILAARSRPDFVALREQFSRHQVEKQYLALVEGSLSEARDLAWPISHDPADPGRARVLMPGMQPGRGAPQDALTFVEPLAARASLTLVRATTRYGRLHQVRAHLAALGHPLAGDVRYGARQQAPEGRSFWLHALRLVCRHPRSGEALTLDAPPPPELS